MHFSTYTNCRRGFHALLFAGLATCLLHSASAAKEIYFKLDGSDIASNQLPTDWDGWITGRAFGQVEDRRNDSEAASPGRAVPTLQRAFHIVRHLDKASPMLAQAMVDGQVFPRLTVLYVEDGGSVEPVRVVLNAVSIVSHQVQVDTVDHPGLTESLSFAFDSASFRYTSPSPDESESPKESLQLANIDPFGPDKDADGLPDAYAKAFGVSTADADDDGDGLTNRQELAAGTAPNDRRSRFGIDEITLMSDKPGQACVTFQTLPRRQYRLLGSPTGQQWFELHRFSTDGDAAAASQEIELTLTGLTQLLRVEVTLEP